MDRRPLNLNYEDGHKLLSYFITNGIIKLPDIIEYDQSIEKEMSRIGYTIVRDWQTAEKDGQSYSSCFIKNPDKVVNNKSDIDSLIKDIIAIIKKHKRMFKKTEDKITVELKQYDYSTVYSVKTSLQNRKDFSKNTYDMVKDIAKIKSQNRVKEDKNTVNKVKDIISRISK